MSKSRNSLAQELQLQENNIKCKNCLKAKDYNEGMYYCNEWQGKISEIDFCSFFEPRKNKYE